MEIIIQPDAASACRLAATITARLIRDKPNAVLGLATGSTPIQLYRELVRMHREENLDFSQVTTFNLDEYVGLTYDHPVSYHAFMHKHLFDWINIPRENIHIPDGLATDIKAYCTHYEEQISTAGGIDLQVLGIGSDGHIGFNEPTSSLASRTRIKTLTEQTRRDNAPFFDQKDEIPYHVITMGIGTIMESRTCLLLAFGARKAEAIAQTVEGPLSAMAPASALQMHPDAKLIVDEPAASQLTHADYYRWVYDNKPEWQQYVY